MAGDWSLAYKLYNRLGYISTSEGLCSWRQVKGVGTKKDQKDEKQMHTDWIIQAKNTKSKRDETKECPTYTSPYSMSIQVHCHHAS